MADTADTAERRGVDGLILIPWLEENTSWLVAGAAPSACAEAWGGHEARLSAATSATVSALVRNRTLLLRGSPEPPAIGAPIQSAPDPESLLDEAGLRVSAWLLCRSEPSIDDPLGLSSTPGLPSEIIDPGWYIST